MEQAQRQRRGRRAFTAEFKAEVVQLCRGGGRTIPEVARDLDLTESAVRPQSMRKAVMRELSVGWGAIRPSAGGDDAGDPSVGCGEASAEVR